MSALDETTGAFTIDSNERRGQGSANVQHRKETESTQFESGVRTNTIEAELRVEDGIQPKVNILPYSAVQFPLSKGSQAWRKRPRSPGLKWYKGYSTPESLKTGRVLVIDYVKQDQSTAGMRKVAAQEISSVEGLRKLYSNPSRCGEAALRVLHVQNADWATRYLLHKFNITPRDELVGTDFGKYLKYERPERRGGKPFLSGKSWKTTHDPWRGISRTSFGIDYLRNYPCPISWTEESGNKKEKMFELNHYDQEDLPRYGFDVYVQRFSCYVQHKEPEQDVPAYMESPYREIKDKHDPHHYVPQLETLDNGNTIIIFENSQSGSIEDTVIAARQHWESRWRRLPFYLAYESNDVSNDDRLALECMKIILSDIWKGIAENWEDFLDVCNSHMSILEEKIYEQPAEESRAPELWTNSSMWLKVERLVAIHATVVKEMQTNFSEFLSEPEVDDNWLEASPGDMERISDLVQEDLIKPTANLADLMYKSVGIRDSRHSLQLSTSMWRLSWITFIFLPLTFISSFFGMNVDIFQGSNAYPSIRWYFASTVPMMALVLIGWYIIKHLLARTRQTSHQRGIYEALFFDLATAYPRLWSRSGPNDQIAPQTTLDSLKWRLITYWNAASKTTQAGLAPGVAQYDDLGAWARAKRNLTRRWTSQIRVGDVNMAPSSTTLEEGGRTELASFEVEGKESVQHTTQFMRTSATGDLPGGMLEVPDVRRFSAPAMATVETRGAAPKKGGDGDGDGVGNGSGRSSRSGSGQSELMVEEEPQGWLTDYGVRGAGRRRR